MYIQVVNNTNFGNHMEDDGKFALMFPISSSSFFYFSNNLFDSLIRKSPFEFF